MRLFAVLALVFICSACKATDATEGVASPPKPDCTLWLMQVLPPTATLAPGDTLRARARVNDCGGLAPGALTWSSSNSNVAVVDTSGLVTAIASGSAVIIATYNPNTKGAMALYVAR